MCCRKPTCDQDPVLHSGGQTWVWQGWTWAGEMTGQRECATTSSL